MKAKINFTKLIYGEDGKEELISKINEITLGSDEISKVKVDFETKNYAGQKNTIIKVKVITFEIEERKLSEIVERFKKCGFEIASLVLEK